MIKAWMLGWAMVLATTFCGAQPLSETSVRWYEKAIEELKEDRLAEAIPLLEKSIAADPNYYEPVLSLAGVNFQLKRFAQAIPLYEKAFALNAADTRLFQSAYGAALAATGRFAEALAVMEKFLASGPMPDKTRALAQSRLANYRFAVNNAASQSPGYRFDPQNLGDSINSQDNEYYPGLTIDDSLLVFTRRAGNVEVFYQTAKPNAGAAFPLARPLRGRLNDEPYKGAINLAQDGEWLAFAGDFGPKGMGNFDIWLSYWTPAGWSEPINAGDEVNSEFYETAPALSPDKQALYFMSTRPGGFGGADIYVSYRRNGRFSPAQNLGPAINTAGDEQSPFVHADGRHLYFSSNGLPGYGDHDLFMASLDSNGRFAQPQNLGYPINTTQHEGSLFVDANGLDAYYASDRSDSRGGLDLYRFQLPLAAAALPTTYLRGQVTDKTNGKGLPGEVVLTNLATARTEARLQTDEQGFYFVTMPAGERYHFTVNQRGYWFYSDTATLSRGQSSRKNIALTPLEKGSSLALKNILFETNKATLQPISFIELNNVVTALQQNPQLRLEVQGHTDNSGNPKLNQPLSEQRAKAVVAWLVGKGIAPVRLLAKGFGASKPVASNATEEGKALNRRTELVVL